LHNPDFKVLEFDHFRMNAGLTRFVLSPGKWVEKLNKIAIQQMKILVDCHSAKMLERLSKTIMFIKIKREASDY